MSKSTEELRDMLCLWKWRRYWGEVKDNPEMAKQINQLMQLFDQELAKRVEEADRLARIDERESMKFLRDSGQETFIPYVQYRFCKDGLMLDWDDRTKALNNQTKEV